MFSFWAEHPPVHEMVASYLGYKKQGKEASSSLEAPTSEEDAAFLAELGPVRTFDNTPLPIQEWARSNVKVSSTKEPAKNRR